MTDAAAMARWQIHDGWGELVLARPERRNALIGPMAAQLRAGLAELLAAGCRAIVLKGDGGAFCSGLDVDAFAAAPAWRDGWAGEWSGFHRELYRCPAVLVGALERYAINAGASLALACDLLVAGEGAWLHVGEAAVGMHAPMNIAWLRLRASETVAAQLLLPAARMSGLELQRLGLAYRVVADAGVVAEAEALATRLAGFPGQALASIKEALRRPSGPGEAVFDAVHAGGRASAGPARVGG
jgi:enoyl-CoA hydratase/carnithine racemase